ncbi:MAG: hypothetical protein JRE64_04230 [Deltaproteobacteria bacterium]|nr:hypothetical protein [Deltaproteobacteria bacterium]
MRLLGEVISSTFLSWEDIIEEAKKKDLWVEPIEVSKIIKEFPIELLTPIKWITQPDLKQAQVSLVLISEDILKGDQNSLVPASPYSEPG